MVSPQGEPKVPEAAVTADDLIAVLGQALAGDAQLPTPESAGFAPDAIRDFLTFVQSHGGFEVPVAPSGSEPVHFGSLMGGLALGAVAARRRFLSALLSDASVEAVARRRSGVPLDKLSQATRENWLLSARMDLQAALVKLGGGE